MGINIRRRRERVRKWTWRRRGKREEGRGMGWVGTLVCRPSEVLEVCKSKRGVRESVRNAATLNFEAGWAENLM